MYLQSTFLLRHWLIISIATKNVVDVHNQPVFSYGLFSLPVLIGVEFRPFLWSSKAEEITLGCEGRVIELTSLNNTTERNVRATRTGWASHQLWDVIEPPLVFSQNVSRKVDHSIPTPVFSSLGICCGDSQKLPILIQWGHSPQIGVLYPIVLSIDAGTGLFIALR